VPGYGQSAVLSLALNPNWPTNPLLLVGTWQGVHRLLTDNPPGGSLPPPDEGLFTLPTNVLALNEDDSLLVTARCSCSIRAISVCRFRG
jgi:hypothetical protein